MKRILTIAIILIGLAGCKRQEEVKITASLTDISLSWKGKTQISYNPANYQLAYNDSKFEYRVYDDKLANWFIVRCSEEPGVEGETVIADVSWTGANSTKSFSALSFEIQKTDDKGLIWLWNASQKIGIVIKNIK